MTRRVTELMRIAIMLTALAVLSGVASAQVNELPDRDAIRALMIDEGLDLLGVAGELDSNVPEISDILGIDFVDDRYKVGYFWPECLVTLIRVKGSADTLGLSREVVRREIEFRLRNDMAYLPICEDSDSLDRDRMEVAVEVWTVGETYPVALHVELDTYVSDWASESMPRSLERPFDTAVLGYGSDTTVQDQVRDAIETVIRALSMDYLRVVR